MAPAADGCTDSTTTRDSAMLSTSAEATNATKFRTKTAPVDQQQQS
jgi:hypothetical protein